MAAINRMEQIRRKSIEHCGKILRHYYFHFHQFTIREGTETVKHTPSISRIKSSKLFAQRRVRRPTVQYLIQPANTHSHTHTHHTLHVHDGPIQYSCNVFIWVSTSHIYVVASTCFEFEYTLHIQYTLHLYSVGRESKIRKCCARCPFRQTLQITKKNTKLSGSHRIAAAFNHSTSFPHAAYGIPYVYRIQRTEWIWVLSIPVDWTSFRQIDRYQQQQRIHMRTSTLHYDVFFMQKVI